ncbi:DUF86 domain-containing protein [Robbsia sp. KACC 23696]|uniref:HepT-like ribonuclease domain-containing protein n=1 Tax=Robbsia sp. KACC 23696 TaxID=3149231 RepID=UPI00325B59E1
MNAKQRALRLADYLEHMLEASHLARAYIADIDKTRFLETRMIQQAVLMNLVIIGESATQIRNEFPAFLEANPDSALPWKNIIGMRNRMIHGYFDTDLEIVWNTVKTHLPTLEIQLAKLAAAAERQQGPDA